MEKARNEIRHRALYRIIAAIGESRKETELAERVGQLTAREAAYLDDMCDRIKQAVLLGATDLTAEQVITEGACDGRDS